MGNGIPQDETAAISIGLEGIVYGFSVLMFVGTIWALTYKLQHFRDVNRPMALVAIVLLVLSTAYMAVDIVRTENAFVKYRDTFPGGPSAYFEDVTQPLYVVKYLILTLQTMVGDGVLIYRCYVVWKSIWIIALPSLVWCFSVVAGIVAPYSAWRATTNASNIYAKSTSQWVTAYCTSTLATNFLGTGLLAYRIWTIDRSVAGLRTTRSPMMYILRVILDAAILYSVALLIVLISFTRSNNGNIVMLYMVPSLISIAFYMVLIRIAIRGRSRRHLSTVRAGTSNEIEMGDIWMKPLQVHISKFTHNDGTSYIIADQGRQSPYKGDSAELAPPGAHSP
ncbi:hypothetical protein M405DRAFT_808472 [Rhizopogon salebrosus TDB-379]|nr:hypothetical protein M405DRAFT_808472 [Rhizopogon salebrosus TDB-379]